MRGLWIWAIVSMILFFPFAATMNTNDGWEIWHLIGFCLTGAAMMGAWIGIHQEYWLRGLCARWTEELKKEQEDWTEEELADWAAAFEQTEGYEDEDDERRE